MHISGEVLSVASALFLLLALVMALSFEFVNGFHDTANAVATVIYTHSLRPSVAVVWSGLWNLIGVLVSTGGVAYGILALLPVELVINIGSGAGYAMVFALLLSAIIWNLGTWYLGLPASSSHTLIGAIMGVGLANSMIQPGHVFGEGVNWANAKGVGLSLLVSPIVGFVGSALLLLLAKALIKSPALYAAPPKDQPPPIWVRCLLVVTCTGVSFAHGSNDGQKGMGLIMLILIGIVPGAFALKMDTDSSVFRHFATESRAVDVALRQGSPPATASTSGNLAADSDEISAFLKTSGRLTDRTVPALIAGTMAANHSGLQTATLRNLLLAWVLTLPVCIFLGATLFAGGFYVVLNVFGVK